MVLRELCHGDARDVFGEDGELAQGAEAGGDGRLAGDAVEREGRGAGGEEVGSVGEVTWGLCGEEFGRGKEGRVRGSSESVVDD